MANLYLDFETRSACDLKKAGAHIYANDPTTDVLCMAWAIDDGPVHLWKLDDPDPIEFFLELKDPNTKFIAHNAQFERLIWEGVCVKKYGWPKLPIEKLYCTMVQAYNLALPGSLENAGNAVGLVAKKDMQGNRVMLQLSKPREIAEKTGEITWWHPRQSTKKLDVTAKFEKLYRYCVTDIIVERELFKRLLPLSESERRTWLLDQKINDRGVFIDLPSVKKALEIVENEQKRLSQMMRDATDNQVASFNAVTDLTRWIELQGVELESVGKADVLDLLAKKDLPEKVKNALFIRQEGAKSSTAKLTKMIALASKDSRARGCFQYYGAFATGRFAGRGIQLQNLPRPKLSEKDVNTIVEMLSSNASEKEIGDYISVFFGSPLAAISDSLRGMIRSAPGKDLISGDFSAIEARVLAWLAGQENILEIFRGHGMIYEYTAQQIYNLERKRFDEISKDQRTIGKVATLALGFQGGVGAFQAMAKVYFVKISDEQANSIKKAWRLANPKIVQYWYDLENASISAVLNPGKKYSAGAENREVTFLKKGSFLFCRLPSGRPIVYPYPKIMPVKTPWGDTKEAMTYMYENSLSRNWERTPSYGGLLAENVTQATARDLLVESMHRWEDHGYPIVLHVHDELVAEVKKGFGSIKQAEELMCTVPAWAKDLPIKCEIWRGERYKK